MNTIELIRIEHPDDGQGLFRRDETKMNKARYDNLLFEIYKAHNTIPTPHQDDEITINIFDYPEYFCGYKSLKQLYEFLSIYDIKLIISLGFKIYIIRVSTAIVSNYQVLYRKTDILHQMDITNNLIN